METTNSKSNFKQTIHNVSEIGKVTLKHTKTITTKLFDTADTVDRKFYGKKLNIFIWGALIVLIVAPIIDELFAIPNDRLTFLFTFIYFMFLFIIFLAWISAWRDDSGNWSLARTFSRLKTYYESLKDSFELIRVSSGKENIYKLSITLIVGGICWKALQNISVFIRKPIEDLFSIRIQSLRDFERFTNHYYYFIIVAGIIGLIYLYKKNPVVFNKLKIEFQKFFFNKKSYSKKSIIIKTEGSEFVLNAKDDQHIKILVSNSESKLFNDFVVALQNWTPKNCYYEYEYQDRLYRHLKKALPDAKIDMEYPIGEKQCNNIGRADIVVNDTILIEMKRDSSAGAIQRAKGQIMQYSEIWKEKGLSILLLCNYDYEHARLSFTPTMNDLTKLQRPVMTIVATNPN